MNGLRLTFSFAFIALLAMPAWGDPATTAAAMRLLKSNCFSCHDDDKKKGGLIMTSRDALLKGGDNGPALDLDAPEKSALLESLAADADPHMPPKKQLSGEQIAALQAWAKGGAQWDAAALIAAASPPRKVALAELPASYRPVLALAVSPDSTRLAVGCGNEVVLYDIRGAGPQLVVRASTHADPVQSVAWSPDGRQLVTGSFRRVVIWNGETLAPEREITDGLTDRIAAVRFLPEGKQAVIADGQIGEVGTVRLVEIGTGAIAASWPAHADTIFDLAVSADGKLLATAGGDKLVKIWDLATRKEIAKLEGHVAQVLSLAFNADATLLVSGGADQQLKVWDVKTRERINELGKHTAAINGAIWSPAGPTVIAVTSAGTVARYTELSSHSGGQRSDSAKERKLESADTALHSVTSTANGERVFAGSQDGRLFAWNKEGKLASKLVVKDADVAAQAPPSFMRDVLPILNKSGCSAGACHAKPDGQNGFMLSIFSFDPQSDHRGIVQEGRGRRVFPAAPGESLLLLKATNTVPHEGGERFSKDSEAYRTLAQWIATGMSYRAEGEASLKKISVQPAERLYRKGDTQPLKVEAHYSDGSKRDVTALADFSTNDKEIAKVTEEGVIKAGTVSGQAVIVARFLGMVGDSRISVPADRLLPAEKYATLPVTNFIDDLAYAQFKQLGLYPSEPCSDAEFLRRATIDTIGAVPTADEARAFLADTAPEKRARLIDRLLDHRFYADHWANKWADLLRPNPDRAGVKSVYVLDQWLRESFRTNKPYDEFVREIVTTEGNTHRFGPAVIYRDRREPADVTTMFSQLFLGVRLDCAKCHHHPSEKWGQDDFYRMAAFFGSLKRKGAGISAPISAGNETFYFAPGRTVKHPVTGEVMEPRPPDGSPVKIADDIDPRLALADWMTDPKNPYFARAIANRIWAAFFGKGIVDPVDDFRLSNPPSNPALLDALAEELVRHDYNLKELMRTILRSHLYQLSTMPNQFNMADMRNFSRSYRRRLPAEVLADAVADITGVPNTYAGLPPGSRAMQAWTYKIDSPTMDAFSRPNSSSDCPCERDSKPSIVQALHLMNSRLLQEKLASKDVAARVQRLAESKQLPEEIVTELYLACYTRPPNEEELKIATGAFAAEGTTRRRATEDVLWSLFNSAEFVFNH
jgi:WD40 repeat protein/mono/diheme cytochrome c family protein